jgi:hypothetical protein
VRNPALAPAAAPVGCVSERSFYNQVGLRAGAVSGPAVRRAPSGTPGVAGTAIDGPRDGGDAGTGYRLAPTGRYAGKGLLSPQRAGAPGWDSLDDENPHGAKIMTTVKESALSAEL